MVLIGSISLFLWELHSTAQNNTDVQHRTGEAHGSTGQSSVCFHGVCGGSVDRGVICPAAFQEAS